MSLGNKTLLIGLSVLVMLGILMAGVAMAQTPLTVTLNEQNSSGETGTTTLSDLGNGMVRVEVTVSGAPAGVSQPMHIHEGTCANLTAAPKFPLNNLENGTSTTEISTTLEALLASPHALNGHKSAAEPQVYVFCGDIVAAAQPTATVTTEATPTVEATSTVAATTTATTEATAAATGQATVTTEATAAATAEATATAAPTLPTTGAGTPWNALVPLLLVGIVMLLLGVYARRLARR